MEEIKLNSTVMEYDCIICGGKLNKLNNRLVTRCDFCHSESEITYSCGENHFICDSCLSLRPVEIIKNVCLRYEGTDPVALAAEIMNYPVINIQGPWHHIIVPAALITCVRNLTGNRENLDEMLEKCFLRAYSETPHTCVYHSGICGAAVGTGTFLRLFTNAEIENEDEWSLSNSIISASLKKIEDSGGYRCCKRDTYLSLETAAEFLKEKFDISLPVSDSKCTFSLRNETCSKEGCIFYNIGFALV